MNYEKIKGRIHKRGAFFVAFVALALLATQLITPGMLRAAYEAGSWSAESPMPTTRISSVAGEINGQLYVVGGGTGSTPPTTTVLEVFNPSSNSWSSKASASISRAGAAGDVINGKLYVAGGCINTDCRIGITDQFEMYDPSSNSWTALTPMPTPRAYASASAYNGKLYVAGGMQACPPCEPMLDTLEVYNPSTDSWSTLSSMPDGLSSHAAAVLNGKIYVAGGSDGGGRALGDLHIYTPSSDSWSTSSYVMPTPRFGAGAATLDGKLYVVGGNNGSGSIGTVEIFDPSTNDWSDGVSIPSRRSAFPLTTIGDQLYAVGGTNEASYLNSMEVYSVDAYEPDPEPDPEPTCSTYYEPVCGTDGVTYTNDCIADEHYATIDYYGECVEEEEEFVWDDEMTAAFNALTADLEDLLAEIEDAESDGYDMSSVHAILDEMAEYNDSVPKPYDYDSFWDPLHQSEDWIAEAFAELDRILHASTYNGFYNGTSNEDVAEMYDTLYEFDEGMYVLAEMVMWFESLGVNIYPLEDLFYDIAYMYAEAEEYMYAGDVDSFWDVYYEMEEYVEYDFFYALEEVLMDSDLGLFFEAIGEELELIDEWADYLISVGDNVPYVYDDIQDINEEIGMAFEDADFAYATELIDELVILIEDFWIAIGEDDHELGFEPPAGYEDEVVTVYDRNPFPDTNIRDLEGKAAADLYGRAVIGGYPDGEFKGERPVNRAEAAKFLLLAARIDAYVSSNSGKFRDVKEGEWYVPFIMTAAEEGIIGGYPDGTYKPADTVNTAEFLKMISLAFKVPLNLPHSYRDVPDDAWFDQYAGIAAKYNLFPNRTSFLYPAKELTRDEVAVAIYQYLLNSLTNY